MTLGGILEFVLGNTFAFVVFCSYGKLYPDQLWGDFLIVQLLMSLQADSGSRWAVRLPHSTMHTAHMLPIPRSLMKVSPVKDFTQAMVSISDTTRYSRVEMASDFHD